MSTQRTVIVAATVSGVLVSASAAFALWSGLFGAGQADRVGTFQAIEQRVVASSTSTTASQSTTGHPTTSATEGSTTTEGRGPEVSETEPSTTESAPATTSVASVPTGLTTTTDDGRVHAGPTTTDDTEPPVATSSPSTSTTERETGGTDDGRGSDD